MLKKHEDAYALSRQLERELTASQAEVAELNSLMVGWKQRATMSETDLEASQAEVERLRDVAYDAITIQDYSDKRAEIAEAEVEELANKYFDMEAACDDHMAEVERLKIQNLEIRKALGDAIWECCKDRNKRTDKEIQKLREAYAKSVERDDFLTQENAKLKADLKRAVYIADWYIYRYDDPLASREEHNKQESLVLEIAAIKGQIK